MATTGMHPNLFDERFERVFSTVWEQALDDVLSIGQEMDFDTADFRMSQVIAGLNTAPALAEGSAISRFKQQQGYDVTITPATYALGFSITEQMREDGLHDLVMKMPAALTGILRNTVKRSFFDLLNNAFDSNFALQTNGTELCATSQAIASGLSTGQNRLTTDADFSETTAEALIDLLGNMINEDGAYVEMGPSRFVTNTLGAFETQRVTSSVTTTEQGTGSSGNGINVVNTLGLSTPLGSPFIEDADATFLIGETSPLLLAWRKRPELYAGVQNSDTRSWNWDARMRFVAIATDWRGVVGTPGA